MRYNCNMDHELGYIGVEDLKTLAIPKDVIRMIPRTVAEGMGILPIGFAEDGALLVAVADPNNSSILEEVQFYTGIKAVKVYYGFRSAVMKAIQENYNRLMDSLASDESPSVDFGAQFIGAENDTEAFPGIFGRPALEQFIEDHGEKKHTSQGVSGSLPDMPLHDIVQVLAAGRKSAVVSLENRGQSGQIHIRDGQIVNAYCGDKEGEEAFYEMIGWNEGDFKVDPDAEIGREAIKKPNEALILEGLRRLDEQRMTQGDTVSEGK